MVTIILGDNQLVLSWLKPKKQLFIVQAYRVVPLAPLDVKNSYIFNPTVLKSHIHQFLATHKLTNAAIACALSGPGIMEQLITHPMATPCKEDFTLQHTTRLVWDYRYLYPQDDGTFTFYACGISQQQLLQYKLLAMAAHLHLQSLTSKRMALLTLYRCMQGNAFRHSQLGAVMQRNNNNIEQLCTVDMVRRLVTIAPHVSLDIQTEAQNLAAAVGLALAAQYDKGIA